MTMEIYRRVFRPRPAAIADDAAVDDRLLHAVLGLDERDREALRLACVDRLGYVDIAARMGISRPEVVSSLSTAMRAVSPAVALPGAPADVATDLLSHRGPDLSHRLGPC